MTSKQTNITQIKWRNGSFFWILCLGAVIFYSDPEMIKNILNLKSKKNAENLGLTDSYAKQESGKLQTHIEYLEQKVTANQNELHLSWRGKDEILPKFIELDMTKGTWCQV